MIVTITGPSASGKTTLTNLLVDTGKFKIVPGYVTRPRREGDTGDDNYVFLTDEEFEEQRDDFCEVIELYGNKYATKWNDILNISKEGKTAIVVLTPEGVAQYKEVAKALELPLVKIWLGNKIDVLLGRMEYRQDRDLQKELSWYKGGGWDIVVDKFNEETQDKVVNNILKFGPLIAKRKIGRIWT